MEYFNLATEKEIKDYLDSDCIKVVSKRALQKAIESKEDIYSFTMPYNKESFLKPKSEIINEFEKTEKKTHRNIWLYSALIFLFITLFISKIIQLQFLGDDNPTYLYVTLALSGFLLAWYSMVLYYTISLRRYFKRTIDFVKYDIKVQE
jgi:hypothetical protein